MFEPEKKFSLVPSTGSLFLTPLRRTSPEKQVPVQQTRDPPGYAGFLATAAISFQYSRCRSLASNLCPQQAPTRRVGH
jgi:hypothetical protein